MRTFKTLLLALIACMVASQAWAQAETLSSARSTDATRRYDPIGAGNVAFAWATYEIAATVEDGDIFEMFRLPPGACVIDGFLRGDDIDTGGESLDMDVGIAANGVDSADADMFGNFGVLTGDATGTKPDVMINAAFGNVTKDGPKCFTVETLVQVEANAASAGGHTGTIYVGAYYYIP